MSTDDKKISDLYQAAKVQQPPEHIDDAILAAAHDAVDNQSRARGPFSGRWPVLTSVAALVVITVVIVPIVIQETPEQSVSEETAATDDNIPARSAEKNTAEPELASRPEPAAPMMMQESSTDVASKQETTDSPTGGNKQSLSQRSAAKKQTPARDTGAAVHSLSADSMLPEAEYRKQQPEQWLQDIEQLLDDNETELARAELKKFRESYPDYAIDQQLLDRFKK